MDVSRATAVGIAAAIYLVVAGVIAIWALTDLTQDARLEVSGTATTKREIRLPLGAKVTWGAAAEGAAAPSGTVPSGATPSGATPGAGSDGAGQGKTTTSAPAGDGPTTNPAALVLPLAAGAATPVADDDAAAAANEPSDSMPAPAADLPVTLETDGSAFVTLVALVLLLGAGLLAVLMRALAPPAPEAAAPPDLIGEVNAALDAARRARQMARLAAAERALSDVQRTTVVEHAQNAVLNARAAGLRTLRVADLLTAGAWPDAAVKAVRGAAESARAASGVSGEAPANQAAACADAAADLGEAAARAAASAVLQSTSDEAGR